jgi:hypothetical protein
VNQVNQRRVRRWLEDGKHRAGEPMSFQLQTPIAFIFFNRPDPTARVFQAIRQAKPPQLFLIADGPRADRPGEAECCAATRAVVEQVDWDCQVLTNYADHNLNCGVRVATGLDWVFSQVEEAIILEDDCLPDSSFFQYCQELLEYYRHDQRVMTISGDHSPLGLKRKRQATDSYYFSIHPRIWGWATWRRAWQLRDMEMAQWEVIRDDGWLDDIFRNPAEARTWQRQLQNAKDSDDYWDYPWNLTCWLHHGLCIVPNTNMVANLGLGPGASRTTDAEDPRANTPVGAMSFPLVHPKFMVVDRQAEQFFYDTVQDYFSLRARLRGRLRPVRRWLKRMRK